MSDTSTVRKQKGGFCRELSKWLTEHPSLLGERSTFAGLVASIERGPTSGNSGTKGCGITRYEPFESWKGTLDQLHDAMDSGRACEMAFRTVTLYERWLFCGRYLYTITSLPAGMHGKLGDLSVVALIVADRLGLRERFERDIAESNCSDWEDIAAKSLEQAHLSWYAARAEVDAEIAELQSEVAQ